MVKMIKGKNLRLKKANEKFRQTNKTN